jgi:hypothetical protein
LRSNPTLISFRSNARRSNCGEPVKRTRCMRPCARSRASSIRVGE